MRPRHRPSRRHLDDRLPQLEERRPDRRVFTPVDRPVEPQQVLELALDVHDVLAVHEANRATEYFLNDRQRRDERHRGRLRAAGDVGLPGGDQLPLDLVRLAMTGQAGCPLLGRDGPEAVDAHEMSQPRVHGIDGCRIVIQDQPHHGAALGADAERQLVVRNHQRRSAVDLNRVLSDG